MPLGRYHRHSGRVFACRSHHLGLVVTAPVIGPTQHQDHEEYEGVDSQHQYSNAVENDEGEVESGFSFPLRYQDGAIDEHTDEGGEHIEPAEWAAPLGVGE